MNDHGCKPEISSISRRVLVMEPAERRELACDLVGLLTDAGFLVRGIYEAEPGMGLTTGPTERATAGVEDHFDKVLV